LRIGKIERVVGEGYGLQLANAPPPRKLTLEGKVTLARLPQRANAPPMMVVTP
jgi:Ni,Fe-hydrogenase III component G